MYSKECGVVECAVQIFMKNIDSATAQNKKADCVCGPETSQNISKHKKPHSRTKNFEIRTTENFEIRTTIQTLIISVGEFQ